MRPLVGLLPALCLAIFLGASSTEAWKSYSCGIKVLWKKYQACCGDWAIYDVRSELCCGGQVYRRSYTGCCYGTPYLSSRYRCCGWDVITQYGSDGCCAGRKYKTSTHVCGQDGQIYGKSTHGSCGGQRYDKETHECCHDREPYDKATEKCCEVKATEMSGNNVDDTPDPDIRTGKVIPYPPTCNVGQNIDLCTGCDQYYSCNHSAVVQCYVRGVSVDGSCVPAESPDQQCGDRIYRHRCTPQWVTIILRIIPAATSIREIQMSVPVDTPMVVLAYLTMLMPDLNFKAERTDDERGYKFKTFDSWTSDRSDWAILLQNKLIGLADAVVKKGDTLEIYEGN